MHPGAGPRLISDFSCTPTPGFGKWVKQARGYPSAVHNARREELAAATALDEGEKVSGTNGTEIDGTKSTVRLYVKYILINSFLKNIQLNTTRISILARRSPLG